MTLLVVPLVLALVLLCGMRSINTFLPLRPSDFTTCIAQLPPFNPPPLIIVNIGIYDQIPTEVYVTVTIIALNTLQIYHWVAERQSGENYQQSSWRNIAHISQRHLTPYRNH